VLARRRSTALRPREPDHQIERQRVPAAPPYISTGAPAPAFNNTEQPIAGAKARSAAGPVGVTDG